MSGSADKPVGSPGLVAVQAAVRAADSCGFVHVGPQTAVDRRYLTGLRGPDRETAVVFLPGDEGRPAQAIYCLPSDCGSTAFTQAGSEERFERHVAHRSPATATGQHVRNVLAARVGEPSGQPLLVPQDLPHDTAVFLQQAGYELASTAAVRTARATKTPAERGRQRTVQTAAAEGMARAETMLAESNSDDGLWLDGRPLTVERLRRAINAALAAAGVGAAANTRIESLPVGSTDQLAAGEPICIRLAPRGPQGYHTLLTRTFVVDSEGGWDRRAFIAAKAGLRAAARHLEAGVDVSTVEGETVAEIGAYGFAVGSEDETHQANAVATVHGVGLSTDERPAVWTESTLQQQTVVAVEASVVGDRAVRVGELYTVAAERAAAVGEYPVSLGPVDRHGEPERATE